MKHRISVLFALFAALHFAAAWDYEGHRIVNQLAMYSLPTNFPPFVFTPENKERIAFLAGEPDRWRNVADLTLHQDNDPEHFLDLEDLADYSLTPATLPLLRYDYIAELVKARLAHPEKFPPADPEKDTAHTRYLPGLLPWCVNDNFAKLKSGFSYLKAFQTLGGTSEEISNAQANIIYIMGVMGHYVGDSTQPLHSTKHHHGWVGDNPNGYTTNRSFHAWIDGGFFKKIGGIKAASLADKIRPAQSISGEISAEGIFRPMVAHLVEDSKQLEPLYVLEKEGKLTGEQGKGREGQPFLENQLVRGGQFLGDIWYTAWQDAVEDKYLTAELKARRAQQAAQAEKKSETKPDSEKK